MFANRKLLMDIYKIILKNKRANKKLLPTPEWREWIRKNWFPKSGSVGSSSGITKTSR